MASVDGQNAVSHKRLLTRAALFVAAKMSVAAGSADVRDNHLAKPNQLQIAFWAELWDKPIVKLVADERGRITSAELFRPGAAFSATRQPDGSIRVVELAEINAPVVKPVRTKEGFLMAPVKIDREAIRRAIRMDRDAR